MVAAAASMRTAIASSRRDPSWPMTVPTTNNMFASTTPHPAHLSADTIARRRNGGMGSVDMRQWLHQPARRPSDESRRFPLCQPEHIRPQPFVVDDDLWVRFTVRRALLPAS